jgi:hypothetical protein
MDFFCVVEYINCNKIIEHEWFNILNISDDAKDHEVSDTEVGILSNLFANKKI